MSDKNEKEIVIIDGQEEEVELAPITLFYGYSFTLHVPNAVVIDTTRSLQIADGINEQDIRVANGSGIFRACFNTVFKDDAINLPKTLEDFRSEGSGVKCVFVLVMQILNSIVQNAELWKQGKLRINIKYPETCLHPREQANLADLTIKLTSGGFREIQGEFELEA